MLNCWYQAQCCSNSGLDFFPPGLRYYRYENQYLVRGSAFKDTLTGPEVSSIIRKDFLASTRYGIASSRYIHSGKHENNHWEGWDQVEDSFWFSSAWKDPADFGLGFPLQVEVCIFEWLNAKLPIWKLFFRIVSIFSSSFFSSFLFVFWSRIGWIWCFWKSSSITSNQQHPISCPPTMFSDSQQVEKLWESAPRYSQPEAGEITFWFIGHQIFARHPIRFTKSQDFLYYDQGLLQWVVFMLLSFALFLPSRSFNTSWMTSYMVFNPSLLETHPCS